MYASNLTFAINKRSKNEAFQLLLRSKNEAFQLLSQPNVSTGYVKNGSTMDQRWINDNIQYVISNKNVLLAVLN